MRKTAAWHFALIVASVLTGACSSPQSQPAGDARPGPTPTVERIPMGELPQVDVDAVLAHTKVLSSDQFEGRAPGGKGEQLTVGYLVDQFRKIGLKPGNPDGTFIQKVPLVGITASPAPLVFSKGSQQVTLKWKDDMVAPSSHVGVRTAGSRTWTRTGQNKSYQQVTELRQMASKRRKARSNGMSKRRVA